MRPASIGSSSPLATIAAWLALGALCVSGAGKKPLFEYDDHYVMLNDFDRNNFYRRALANILPSCGPECSVIDVGAGSGLLSMMAAHIGAAHVLAIEANPNLATLAEQTVRRNQHANFAGSNVTVVAAMSSAVNQSHLPRGRKADILVTETFGTMLLGEGAINFIPDARDRLLKDGGIVIPAGGCQYATLVEIPDLAATMGPGMWGAINLTRLNVLQDTLYWKATVGASRTPFTRISDRICILEVDLTQDTKESIPDNRTFRIPVRREGTVHAVLFDWDIWADASRSDILSTAPGTRNYAGDVAWGWLLQLQEEVDEDWGFGPIPKQLQVAQGDWLDIAVDYIAKGISVHVRTRKVPIDSLGGASPKESDVVAYPKVSFPARMRGVDRGDMIQANEFYLPIAGDGDRHTFYRDALALALHRNATKHRSPTVLDCSSGAGVPALVAAKDYGLRSLTVTRRNEFANVLRNVAEDNGVGETMEAYAIDPRDLLEILLPNGEQADMVVVDPPGTPVHGLNPFAILPSIQKRLLKSDGLVIPAGACFEVGLVDSEHVAQMFSIPGGRWQEVDLTVWNEEARRQHVLERLVPHTKWFGSHSSMEFKWLSKPQCIFEVDLTRYGREDADPESRRLHEVLVAADGRAHALVATWVVWDDHSDRSRRLSAESEYFGRALTWPHYVQALAMPETIPGILEPISVQAGERWQLEVIVRQGTAKRTGAAGPEFSLQLQGKLPLGVGSHPIEL